MRTVQTGRFFSAVPAISFGIALAAGFAVGFAAGAERPLRFHGDNTVFIFCADNGTAVTAKSRGVERGCRVPLIVCPILDAPRGRFYFCGTSHDGRGYRRAEGKPEHAEVGRQLDSILEKHPGLTADHPYFTRPKAYQSPLVREKHLHNHKDYRFYDETLP